MAVLGVLVAGGVFIHLPVGKVSIQPGRDTTYFDGPLRADGTVDYDSALDGLSKDARPEDNAYELLMRLAAPARTSKDVQAEPASAASTNSVGEPRLVPWSESAEEMASSLPYDHLWQELARGETHPLLLEWLQANEPAMPRIIEMSHKTFFRSPNGEGLWVFKTAGRLLAIRAMQRARQGKWDESASDVLAAHRLARLVGDKPYLGYQILACEIEQTAAGAGTVLALQPALPADQARVLLAQVRKFKHASDIVSSVDVGQRVFWLDAVQQIYRGQADLDSPGKVVPPPDPGSIRPVPDLDWNLLLRQTNRLFEQGVAALRIADPLKRQAALKAFEESRSCELDRALGVTDAHSLGMSKLAETTYRRLELLKLGGWPCRGRRTHIFASVFCDAYGYFSDNIVRRECLARTAVQMETAILALASFKADKGRWPTALAELVPDYLPQVPTDIMADRPLNYKPSQEGYLLYGVGKNYLDDRGQGDDQVAQFPPPAPAPLAPAQPDRKVR